VAKAIAKGADETPAADLARTIRVEHEGAVHRLLPRVVPLAASSPQQRGAILLLYDVTDLVRVDEMRSELVAVASHELQTPLTTLRMTLLMLQEAAHVLPARQRELVATSLIGVEQLSETIHEFLDLTRIEAGELRLNLEPVHVSAVVAEALQRVEGAANAKAISLTTHGDVDLPQISADPLRLRAVFDNILSNAIKYTPKGGGITVESNRVRPNSPGEPELVRISITDTGPGIPAGFRSRIFEKFFRLEHHQSATRPAARGAGIGLYMSRQIVELHGGEIACGAGRNDHGTCITVTLRPTVRDATPVDDAVAVA
jgi:two-component system, NtrC family, sensor histidine kinase KinB